MSTKLLYVEDEESIGKVVYEVLSLQNFSVQWEKDGAKVMSALESFKPDICLLDIMLPNIDGYALCEKIRQKSPSMPIIFLSAKTQTEDIVKGFEMGGTEYIRKPFSITELIVRIKNQLALHYTETKETERQDEIQIGNYSYLAKRFELKTPSGKLIKLSSRDGELLDMMVVKTNQIISRKDLLMSIWGDDSFFHSRNLDVYINKLRKHLSEDPNIEIQTLRGKGYLFLLNE